MPMMAVRITANRLSKIMARTSSWSVHPEVAQETIDELDKAGYEIRRRMPSKK